MLLLENISTESFYRVEGYFQGIKKAFTFSRLLFVLNFHLTIMYPVLGWLSSLSSVKLVRLFGCVDAVLEQHFSRVSIVRDVIQ